MKTKLAAVFVLFVTLLAVNYYPLFQTRDANATIAKATTFSSSNFNPTSTIEVVFALDTTGSMQDLLQTAKEKIWSIASTMASSNAAPIIKMGVVAYRDRGDAYITKRINLSSDLDTVYAQLMDFTAEGGGDGPESVNQALHEAVHNMSWSQDKNTYKVIFLVGDAPPHMDYPDDVKYPDILQKAHKKGILINTIQCGQDGSTRSQWRHIAALGNGTYFQVEQGGNAVAMVTPFDKNLAELSKKLDDTRLSYGNSKEKAQYRKKLEATNKLHTSSSVSSRARRAAFNVSKSGYTNQIGKGELIDDVTSGRIDLSSLKSQQLPKEMQTLTPQAQQKMIKNKSARRKHLKQKIEQLAQKRTQYLNKKIKETGGAKDSLDAQIYSTIRQQGAAKGMRYDEDNAAY